MARREGCSTWIEVYGTAHLAGCEQKGLCEPYEIPLRQALRWAPKRQIISAKASIISQGLISVA